MSNFHHDSSNLKPFLKSCIYLLVININTMKKYKKLLTLSAITFIHFSLSAQQWSGNNNTTDIISRTGKVGLGTTNPVGRLEVFDDVITQVEKGSVGSFTYGQIVDSKIINKL